jgi:hypothetical protein
LKPYIRKVKLPQQELGASFGYKQKTSLSPSGCRYISRQESGVLCGLIKDKKRNREPSPVSF